MTLIGLFFIALGALIHYGGLYSLIAGYNTMSATDKKKVDIEGIGKLFWYVMVAMGVAFMSLDGASNVSDIEEFRDYAFWVILVVGLGFLLWKSNSSRYKL